MNDPRITIITPSFNQRQFIEDAIASVLAQNYLKSEHIIVDNCSSDGTLDILRKYPHLTWVSEPDRGQCHALNKAVALSTGKYILWLNADDYLLPDAMRTLADCALRFPEADYVYGHMLLVNEQKQPIRTVYHLPYFYTMTFFGIYVPPSTGALFRRSWLAENPLDERFHYTMDTEWFLRCGSQIRTCLINRAIFAFRVSKMNKTAQHIVGGIVNPQHLSERILARQIHVYSRWRSIPPNLQQVCWYIGHILCQLPYYALKLRYLKEYVYDLTKGAR